MPRPAHVFLTLAALVAAAAAAPSASLAKRSAAAHVDPVKIAARDFATFRHAARKGDRVPAIPKVPAAVLRRSRAKQSRLVASGPDFAAYMVVGRGSSPRDIRADLLYVSRQPGQRATLVSRLARRLSTVVRDGAALTSTLPSGMSRIVVIVRDGTSGAQTLGALVHDGTLQVSRNALVDVAVGGEIQAKGPNGRVRSWRIPLALSPGTSLAANVELGSFVHVDDGKGLVRDFRLVGDLHGSVRGGDQSSRDTTITMTEAALGFAPLLPLHPGCDGSGPDVDNRYTRIVLDPTRSSTITLGSDRGVSATVTVRLHTVLDLDGPNSCFQTIGGYADSPALTVALHGTIDPGAGPPSITLESDPAPMTIVTCRAEGDPEQPCPSATTPVDVTASVSLVVSVKIV